MLTCIATINIPPYILPNLLVLFVHTALLLFVCGSVLFCCSSLLHGVSLIIVSSVRTALLLFACVAVLFFCSLVNGMC